MQFPFKLPKRRDLDVVGFGTNAVDFLIQVPEYPAFNSKIELTNYIQAAGGEVASTTVGLRRLGCTTAYVGRFGDDEAGRFGLQSLMDEGVDTSLAEVVPGAHTQIAFIVIDERNGERTVIWKRDNKLAFRDDQIPLEAVGRTKILHFTPHDVAACIRFARAAKDAGVIVSIDIDNIFDGVSELLPLVDILIASQDLPARLLGISDRSSALKELQARFGCGIVGITRGEVGSLLLSSDVFIETEAFPVPGGCKDTTGAGDAFRVGLLFGLLKGSSIQEAAEMANAVASLKCRSVGARTALPTINELGQLLRSSNLLADAVK